MRSAQQDTIYALSSGNPPSGVAVIRLSGPQSRFAVETMSGTVPQPGSVSLRTVRDPATGQILDRGLVLWFASPKSFTGEDSAEFHIHGGRAVAASVLDGLGRLDGFRLAEPGEFARRAFENGKLDLTEIEGLADLIAAETEAQRRLAVRQAGGALREKAEDWRRRLVRIRAMVEANFDFAEEEDIPGDEGARALQEVGSLAGEIGQFLDDNRAGEIVRDGLQVVLAGRPNSGKSSLLNALARRDVAIVTEEAGTTRDLIEVHLDLEGFAVTLVDTAGIRETGSAVESEGIRRALERAGTADLVLWLSDSSSPGFRPESAEEDPDRPSGAVTLFSKDDNGQHGVRGVSVKRGDGLDGLLGLLRERLPALSGGGETGMVTRRRQREALERCLESLRKVAGNGRMPADLAAEHLREASQALGRLTGRVDVEDLLDVIFSEFCVGK